MRFEFLGHVAIVNGARRVEVHGDQPALLLARLVLERPSPLPRDELADLLWPHGRPAAWHGPARQVVSRARALLQRAGAPLGAITSRDGWIELRIDGPLEVDVEEPGRDGAFFPASDAKWTRSWQERLARHC